MSRYVINTFSNNLNTSVQHLEHTNTSINIMSSYQTILSTTKHPQRGCACGSGDKSRYVFPFSTVCVLNCITLPYLCILFSSFRYDGLPERYLLNAEQAHSTECYYPLRPEFVESTYYLFRATRDHKYLHVCTFRAVFCWVGMTFCHLTIAVLFAVSLISCRCTNVHEIP